MTNYGAQKKSFLFGLVFILIFVFSIEAQEKKHIVYVNAERVEQSTLNELASYYRIEIRDGRYWYDRYNGAWGVEGGPVLGFAAPYINLGGRLNSNASNGDTNVFVNGRELHWKDVQALQGIINVRPGRYWLDAKGNGGYEGAPATFNLLDLARQKKNSSFFRNSYTGIGGGSSGGTSYVIGKDFSVIID